MSRRMADENLPIGKLTRIKDVLPPPDQLALPEDTIKVTLRLSKSSVRFFKRQAVQHRTKYQKMIRQLVDHYADRYGE